MSHPSEIRHDGESPKHHAMVQAAGKLFMTQGYGTVSMDAVARAAGVSKATLYAHFASKDALFATIVSGACRRSMAVGGMMPEFSGDLAASLTELGRRILRFLLAPEALAIHRVVVAETVRFPELGRVFYENGPEVFRKGFAAWLAAHLAAGRLDVANPLMAADQFVGMLRAPGVFLRASLGVPPPPTDAEIDATVTAAVRTFLRAYAPRAE